VTEAPGRVLELESRYAVPFDRNAEGAFTRKPFAGQTHDRTVHKGDLTGIEIIEPPSPSRAQARPSIRAFEECARWSCLRDDAGRAAGALILDVRNGSLLRGQRARDTAAMGGGPTMYRVIACSAKGRRRHRAGVPRRFLRLRDMEMIHYPRGSFYSLAMRSALLEEGARARRLRKGSERRRRHARYDAAAHGAPSTRDLVRAPRFWRWSRGPWHAQRRRLESGLCRTSARKS